MTYPTQYIMIVVHIKKIFEYPYLDTQKSFINHSNISTYIVVFCLLSYWLQRLLLIFLWHLRLIKAKMASSSHLSLGYSKNYLGYGLKEITHPCSTPCFSFPSIKWITLYEFEGMLHNWSKAPKIEANTTEAARVLINSRWLINHISKVTIALFLDFPHAFSQAVYTYR